MDVDADRNAQLGPAGAQMGCPGTDLGGGGDVGQPRPPPCQTRATAARGPPPPAPVLPARTSVSAACWPDDVVQRLLSEVGIPPDVTPLEGHGLWQCTGPCEVKTWLRLTSRKTWSACTIMRPCPCTHPCAGRHVTALPGAGWHSRLLLCWQPAPIGVRSIGRLQAHNTRRGARPLAIRLSLPPAAILSACQRNDGVRSARCTSCRPERE